jgi:hypothetical protein
MPGEQPIVFVMVSKTRLLGLGRVGLYKSPLFYSLCVSAVAVARAKLF